MRLGYFTMLTLIGVLHFVIPFTLIWWTWARSYTSIMALGIQLLVLHFLHNIYLFARAMGLCKLLCMLCGSRPHHCGGYTGF